MRRTILEARPDYVVHFAALPIANVAVRQSEEAFQGILQGSVNVLEILRDVDFVQRFVYISSSMAYGDFEKLPLPADAPKHPKDIYGSMKLAGEILAKAYAHRYNIAYTILRPSAVYGPTDNNRRVVQKFLENALAKRPIKLIQGRDAVLDFTYVTDVAEGIYLAATFQGGVDEDFNITRGEGRTLSELTEILRSHFPDLQIDDVEDSNPLRPRRGALDINKVRRLLGYDPRSSLEDGVAEYLSYMKKFNRSILPLQA